ncbi:MAG: hypothetical protein NVS2B12_33230 [Ktedonobacteraceae bacterium]
MEKEVSGYGDFQAFLADPASGATTGLVFGLIADTEDYSDDIVEMLIEHREHFQQLTALFLGDITSEESEISWIELGDVAPIFTAYPRLEHIHICGNASSSFHFRVGILHNEYLKMLIVETGCLDRSVVHDILRSHLPSLEHLELWTGDEGRGANCTVEDFAALFTTTLFPKLRSLGLRNSEFANDLAIALSQSPLLEQLRVLDLSLGLLDDIGATALLSCPAVYNLEKLDIHYHYCSQEMVQRLQASGIEVDASDQQEPELSDDDDGGELRFVAVSE